MSLQSLSFEEIVSNVKDKIRANPTPAPELELLNTQGEAEEKKDTEKMIRKKGKKALKISKNDTSTVMRTGRNII